MRYSLSQKDLKHVWRAPSKPPHPADIELEKVLLEEQKREVSPHASQR